ncbi:MAG: ParB/RepB/Spo0J family partition protein, partial [Acutalibacteraceae bacterium]|nr:ParB/RepB/Spo0J family partition protein [Acutalibacteraceae bacterium]
MFNKNIKSPVNIPVSKIHPFEGNPYKVLDNDEMNTLICSIQEQGILTPIIIRPIESTDEYEVISGHRRLHATVKAGMKVVPAFINAVTRDEAAIMLVDSNLHREHILPSEKAFAYKLKLDALKHQGKTSAQVGQKWSVEQVAEESSDSRSQIQRYIRLTYLIPELLELVDEEKIALTPAVELSYLTDEEQYSLLGTIEEEDRTPSLSQAVRFKKLSQAGELSDESIETIMQEDKANQKPMFKTPMEKLQKVAPKVKDKDFEDFVLKACEHYYRYLQRQRNRDAR